MIPSLTTSVALATYNGSKYILEQLNSLSSQSVPPDEVIVSDDGSDDHTVAIVEKWASEFKGKVEVFRNNHPLGISKNFEKACSQCRGQIIFPCDQDDLWLPEKLEVFIREFSARPDLKMAFCDGQVCDGSLNYLNYSLWDAQWFTPGEQSLAKSGKLFNVLLKHSVTAGNTLAFRNSLKDRLFPIPHLKSCHDHWIGLMGSLAGYALIPTPLIKYRLHGKNQIGIQKLSLWKQFQFGLRVMDRKYFKEQLTLYSELENRTREGGLPGGFAVELSQRIRHAKFRCEAPEKKWHKVPSIFSAWQAGDYSKFSYGTKSFLQDLILRW